MAMLLKDCVWHRTVLNSKVCMKEEVEGRSEQIHGRQEARMGRVEKN